MKITLKNSLVLYSILACAITWIIVLPLVLSAQGIIGFNVPFALHYLAPYGPFLSVFIVSWIEKGGEGIREMMGDYRIGKVKPFWLLASLSPWIFFIVAGVAVTLMGESFPSLDSFGFIQYGNSSVHLPFIGAWLLWILTFGVGEETGWRGFMLPRLQEEHNALMSSMILGFVWCFWHAPVFLYNPNFQAFSFIGTIMWAVGLMFGSVFLAWLFNSCEGSITLVALWHGTFNTFSAAAGQSTSTVSAIITMLVMVSTVVIVLVFKPQNLSQKERQTP